MGACRPLRRAGAAPGTNPNPHRAHRGTELRVRVNHSTSIRIMTKRTDRITAAAAAARRARPRVNTPDADADAPAATEEERTPTTASAVRWADVQVDTAARRVQQIEEQLASAKRDLAERSRLLEKMTEAHELHASAALSAHLLEQRAAEAEQRSRDAALAKEQAKIAAQRKQEAQAALQSARQRGQAADEAVVELQQSLSASSREGSSVGSAE